MNIMDKETVLRVSKAVHITGNVEQNDVIEVLTEFIKDNGKNEKETNEMLTKIIRTGITLFCLPVALEYYEKKFNIVKVIKNNRIINVF